MARGAAEIAIDNPTSPEAHIFRVVAVAAQQAASELEKAELEQPEDKPNEPVTND